MTPIEIESKVAEIGNDIDTLWGQVISHETQAASRTHDNVMKKIRAGLDRFLDACDDVPPPLVRLSDAQAAILAATERAEKAEKDAAKRSDRAV
jgi:hypothetical protein